MSKIDDSLRSWYNDISWEYLERGDLGSGEIGEAKTSLAEIKSIFDLFLNIKRNRLSNALGQRVEIKLQNFKHLVEQIDVYSDIRQKNEIITTIGNFEYDLVNDLGVHIAYYRNLFDKENKNDSKSTAQKIKSQIINELSLDEKKLNNARDVINQASQNKESLLQAIEGSKQWLSANKEVVDTIIKNSANDAKKKAKEHATVKIKIVENYFTTRIPVISHCVSLLCWLFPGLNFIKKFPIITGTIWWLIGSFTFGLIVLCIISYFVIYIENPSISEILLKLSSVIVPSYFALFCANQYTNHRRLYENYMFKDVALTTMISLRGQYKEGSASNDVILEKSLNVIFNEPVMSVSEMKVDRSLLKDVVELIKR
jgi:hypothetical protein